MNKLISNCKERRTISFSNSKQNSLFGALSPNGKYRKHQSFSQDWDLLFWENLHLQSSILSSKDYVVTKIKKRNARIATGVVKWKTIRFCRVKWKEMWVELYPGCILLRKVNGKKWKKRIVLTTGNNEIRLVDFSTFTIQVSYLIQSREYKEEFQLSTKKDMFTWWWCLQLAAFTTIDKNINRYRIKESKNPTITSRKYLKIGNVIFGEVEASDSMYQISVKNEVVHHKGVTHLIFICHGEVQNSNFLVCDRDKGLTERGISQVTYTAKKLKELLTEYEVPEKNVSILYGNLRRTVETAKILCEVLTSVKKRYPCALLEEAAPKFIDFEHRGQYRAVLHALAFENICRWDVLDHKELSKDHFKIIVCTERFIQYCLAIGTNVPVQVIQAGAPIANASLSHLKLYFDHSLEIVSSNRITHLPLTYQTTTSTLQLPCRQK